MGETKADDRLWRFEERLWLGGRETYEASLDPDCLMAFPEPAGIMKHDDVIESLDTAPRWASIRMTKRSAAHPRDNMAVLAYTAEAFREGREPYTALCTSTWFAPDGVWRMVQHQQTPI